MDSKALIQETLKYLDTDKNGQPKYRFDVYKKGANAPEPIRVYTVGDLFDTLGDVSGDVLLNIGDLRPRLNNIKVSLEQLGYTALNTTINTLMAAIIPIETVQTIENIYRVAKPLSEKVADVASIMFHFPYTALIAQDVLQYLARLAVQTARNYLEKLWQVFMNTPIFAIYENTGDTVNLSEVYSIISTEANKMINGLASDKNAFNELVNYINTSSNQRMNWPEYNNLGIVLPYPIVDIYHDPITRTIIIACYDFEGEKSYIYQLNADYSTRELYSTNGRIQRIYLYNNEVYYIINNNTIIPINDPTHSKTIEGAGELKIIFSTPVMLYSGNKIYDSLGEEVLKVKDDDNISILFQCYNMNEDVIYYVINEGTDNNPIYNLYNITKNSLDMIVKESLGTLQNTPYGLVYFNGYVYVVFKNSKGYYLVKISTGISFDKEYYDIDINKDFILWTDSDYATNGECIFKNSGSSLKYIGTSPEPINTILEVNHKNKNYLISTGGINIFSQPKILDSFGNINSNWNEKSIYNQEEIDTEKTPENLAGCVWFNSSVGDAFLAYSHKSIMLFCGSDLDPLFAGKEPEVLPSVLLYKQKGTFKEWFDEHNGYLDPSPVVTCTYKLELENEENIITTMKVIDKNLYVALYNTKASAGSEGTKSGVYKVSVTNDYKLVIDYDHPEITTDTVYKRYNIETDKFEKIRTDIKIYSFDKINNYWYYTDGKLLYNATNNFSVDLELVDDEDRSVYIKKVIEGEGENKKEKINIYTSKGLLTPSDKKNYEEVKSSLNYESTTEPEIAYTRNGILFSDGELIYNIIDTEGYELPYELFQVCYVKGVDDFNLIQSNDAVFIVSDNVIKRIPLYSFITSSDYGCGYYTDTTLNQWYGAAPYYFASNALNSNKQNPNLGRSLYINSFRDNFKVELEKLLKNVPTAFVNYTKGKLKERLEALGVSVENDDGQITNLIIDSVSSSTANSIGMYVQQKFYERIGDDYTYNTFANAVYDACIADSTNNMTKDFYDIFSALYYSTIIEGITIKDLGPDGPSDWLLRYYQNHKGEWAESMTDLIDVDIVDNEIYEIPLNSTQTVQKKTYVFDYYDNKYVFDYESNPYSKRDASDVINGYAKKEGGEVEGFYEDEEFSIPIDVRVRVDSYIAVSDPIVEDLSKYYEKVGDEYVHTSDTIIDPNKTYYLLNITYYDKDGNVICYYNPEDNLFYKYKIEDYVESDDTEEEPDKTYYKRVGDNTYYYFLSDDTSVEPDKNYFIQSYMPTGDEEPISGKKYFEKVGGGTEYKLVDDSDFVEGEDYLKTNSYFEKVDYFLTSDTSVDSSKTYYKFTYTPTDTFVTGEQYYIRQYLPTEDTVIDLDKTYYEKLDFSDYVNDPDSPDRYIYTPGTGTHNLNYTRVTDDLNSEETYYVLEDGEYVEAKDVNLQGGPYYIVDGFVEAEGNNGDWTIDNNYPAEDYTAVSNPSLENLASYYEYGFGEISDPATETAEVFKKDFTLVSEPIDVELSSYYEKSTEDEYVESELNYVYSSNGDILGVVNDRTYYKQVYEEEEYREVNHFYTTKDTEVVEDKVYYVLEDGEYVETEVDSYFHTTDTTIDDTKIYYEYIDEEYVVVEEPAVADLPNYYEKTNPSTYVPTLYEMINPNEMGLYEYGYSIVDNDTIFNPHDEGYYEREYLEIGFEETAFSYQETMYEKVPTSYSVVYEENKIYVDLIPSSETTEFDVEDEVWHREFYDLVGAAWSRIDDPTTPIEELKTRAIVALNGIISTIQPSYKWKEIITSSVTEYYIPTQSEQFKAIVMDSNMYPIKWDELPDDLNHESFDYALTALLYEIKQRLIANIAILVDNGRIKCYSCVDANTVIRKMVERNGIIWMNQLNIAKRAVRVAATYEQIKKIFEMAEAYEPSRYMLKNILDKQSRLYSKYIDQLIEEQVINDNDTEVVLNND